MRYWPVKIIIQCGVNFFILDLRRVLAPAPKVLGSDIKTHLKSRFYLQAIWKNRGTMLELEIDWAPLLCRDVAQMILTPCPYDPITGM